MKALLLAAAAVLAAAALHAAELRVTAQGEGVLTYDTLRNDPDDPNAVAQATQIAASDADPTDLVSYVEERIAAALGRVRGGDGIEVRYDSAAGTLTVAAADPPAVLVRAGWSEDAAATADELTAASAADGSVVLPAGTGFLHLLLWRADASGGDPDEVRISGALAGRNIFGAASDLEVGGVAGKVIASVNRQNAALLGGETARLE